MTRSADQVQPVVSVERALKLIQLVSSAGGVRMADAGRELGLAPSTAYRLLSTLEAGGFVFRSSPRGPYLPGPALFRLANDRDAEEREFRIAGEPHLRVLAEETGETSHLVVLRGAEARFIAGAESGKALRAGLRIGQDYPAHCVSAGKAMLAALPADSIEQIYPTEAIAHATTASCRSREQLVEELALVRERGYAINLGESEHGIHGVGAAIVDAKGRTRGGVAIGAPATRLSESDIGRLSDAVVGAAAAISDDLGRHAI